MMRVSDTGEHGLIELLRERFPMGAVGDDAAVLSPLDTPVVTTDSFFEGTHFFRWWVSPKRLAMRLLEAALSDIAAMGAVPRCVVASLMLPRETEVNWIIDFYSGLTHRPDCPVVGGETISGPVFGLTLTAIGDCGGWNPFLRSAVEPGDSLWLTGPLGRSLDSPRLLQKGRTGELSTAEKEQTELFLSPRARFDLVASLRKLGVKAAIDVSDGLFSECLHLSRESGVQIAVELELVPLVPYAGEKAVEACRAGEDFELLFALPAGSVSPGEDMCRIGTVREGSGLLVTNHGNRVETGLTGYDHFS